MDCTNMEYMVKVWGGAWNSDAEPSIERDYGIKEGCHYFKTEKERDDFVSILRQPNYKNQGIMISIKNGIMTHKRTIFVGNFRYQGKDFTIHYDFGYEYAEDDALYAFEYGNYSCDCNRSLFIQNEYGEEAIELLNCGYEIELIDYHFEYWD